MRERLTTFLGTEAYRIRIETFHAFCDDVIRTFPEYFPISLNSQPLNDIEKFQIFEHLLQTLPLTELRTINSPFHYLRPLIKAISDLKREGISPEKYQQLFEEEAKSFEEEQKDLKKTALAKRQRELGKMAEIGVVYKRYQELLQERRRYDYDDMIRFVAEAFKNSPELLAEYQEKFLYILVDEYQDTNAAQNQVVDLLASYWGEQANICVVGDPHQSIYRFQGASLENTLGFLHRYPHAEVITLEQGYRSPQSIYDAAAAVIKNNPRLEDATTLQKFSKQSLQKLNDGLQTTLTAQKKTDVKHPIQVAAVPTQYHEQIFVMESVKKLLSQGVSPMEIGILYRTNADGLELYEAFSKANIPVSIDTSQDIFESHAIQQFFLLLRAVLDVRNGQENGDLVQLLFAPWWNLERLPVMMIIRAAGKTHMSPYERMKPGYIELIKIQEAKDLKPLDFETVQEVFGRIERWGQEEAHQPFSYWLETVLNESGYLDWLKNQPDRLVLFEQFAAVLRLARQLAGDQKRFGLEQFLDTITTMQEHQLAFPVETAMTKQDGVTFSTVHKAKGQEWEHVFVIQCQDGRWGNARAGRSLPLPSGLLSFEKPVAEDKIEDDRRLFYVALTRAKKQVTFSYPETTMVGQISRSVLGSMFLEEIPQEKKVTVDFSVTEEKLTEHISAVVQPATPIDWSKKEDQWLKQIVAEMPLSVSALNTYLRDPQQFFFRHILRVPERTDPWLAFGTAIHAALEMVYRSWVEDQAVPAEKEVFARFEWMLEQQQLPAEEFKIRLERGKEVLASYLQRQIKEARPVFIEKFFGYGSSSTLLGDIRLTGRIDRVDWLDRSAQTVQVVDYKTGRSKTANEVEGKVSVADFSERELALPEPIRGPLKRQLLFYKLLLELDRSFTGTVTSGMFEFVEPDRDGKVVDRQFELEKEDVELLKKLIIQVVEEIRQLKFLNT
jgi:DNA helicase-2/ATP-dependent DNA helicase PcrA